MRLVALLETLDSDAAGLQAESHHLKGINMLQTVEIFTTGQSQSVLLPPEFHFDVSEVFIRRNPADGSVVLSRRPSDWQGLLDAVAQNKDDDFLLERRPVQARRTPVVEKQE